MIRNNKGNPISEHLGIMLIRTFITLADQILTAKKEDPNANTSALEKQIAEMVYALYGLSPEEIAIVERKM